MNAMKSTLLAVAAFAALGTVAAAPAQAGDLTGTSYTIEVEHTGTFGFFETGLHTYGGPDTTIADPGFPSFFMVFSTPAGAAGYDNSMLIDFTNFAYGDFAGETGTLSLVGLALDHNGDAVLLNENDAVVANGTGVGDTFTLTWSVDDILSAGTGTLATVAWNNKIPAPGALALFGLAGLAGRRRRH